MSMGLASWLRYCIHTSLNGSQPNFARCLADCWAGIIYILFGGSCPWQNFSRCKIHFRSKSCVLLYWQRYCTALQQRASAKLCGVVQGMELRNFRRRCHLYWAARSWRWALAHILVLVIIWTLFTCTETTQAARLSVYVSMQRVSRCWCVGERGRCWETTSTCWAGRRQSRERHHSVCVTETRHVDRTHPPQRLGLGLGLGLGLAPGPRRTRWDVQSAARRCTAEVARTGAVTGAMTSPHRRRLTSLMTRLFAIRHLYAQVQSHVALVSPCVCVCVCVCVSERFSVDTSW